MPARWIALRAYAKLNLCLEVLGRRPDAYHDLATVFQAIDLYDTVRVELEPGGGGGTRVLASGWPVPGGAANLCWRAVAALRAKLAATQEDDSVAKASVTVRLTKRLPPGGGLGGGSSDAAAVLVGLNRLLGRPLGQEELVALAATLGSDVAFLAAGVPAALATGRGEKLQALPSARGLAVVVAWPGEPVSTAWAYGQLSARDFGDGEAARRLAGLLASGRDILGGEDGRASRSGLAADAGGLGANAFLEPVATRRPEIRRAIAALEALGAAPASLAGSGACVWGAFPEAEAARDAAARLRAEGLWAHEAGPAAGGGEVIDVSG